MKSILSTGILAVLMGLYRRAILRVRSVFTTGIFAILCLMVLFGGFLVIHVALFILLPWSLWTKGLILLVLGLVYFFVPLTFLLWFLSKRRWMHLFGAD